MVNALNKLLESGVNFVENNKKFFKNISRAPLYNDEPQLFHYSITFQFPDSQGETTATGVSFDKKKALMKVFGETIERMALETQPGSLPFLSYKEIRNAINPDQFSPFSQIQLDSQDYSNSKIRMTDKFHWIEGYSLTENKKVSIPAQLVFVPLRSKEKEPYIREQISTGSACGSSLEDAIYRGLCEIIERDSFMIGYLNKLPFPRLEIDSIKNKAIQGIITQLKRYRLEYFVVNTTTDIRIPSFAAIVIDRTKKGPAVSIGLKAGFDIENGIIGALEESLMTRAWLRDEIYYKKTTKQQMHDHIVEFEERGGFWFPINTIKYLDFWTKNNATQKISHISPVVKENFYKEAIQKVSTHSDIYYVDITPNDAKKLGFFVVKVLAPKLYPLYLDESLKYLGVKRLYEVPVKLGYAKKPISENELNSIPHPIL